MTNKDRQEAEDLFDFIEKSPTAFHTVETMKEILSDAGFEELCETKSWQIDKGEKYFVCRNHSALIAFCVPKDGLNGCRISASHTDSPAFKLKENPEMDAGGAYVKLNVEKYGGMILSTWLDRPLSIAGRVFTDGKNGIEEHLVCLDEHPVVIPNLAIHMDRKMNEGYAYQVQRDMLPIFSERSSASLKKRLAKELSGRTEESGKESDILSEELYLCVKERGALIGDEEEWMLAPRLDDLFAAFVSLSGICRAKPREHLSVSAFLDNEEVGSGTKQGANSDFLTEVLDRIFDSLNIGTEERYCIKNNSFLVSADNAHAVHPNHQDKADPTNQPRMNGGLVLKYHGGAKYTTDAYSAAVFKKWCREWKIPYQTYHNHSDIAGGSTLGNIMTSHLSIPAVDIGFAQLAMHSAVETAGRKDIRHGIHFFEKFFSF